MAVFTTKPVILLEENQYSNFEWIGETDDGCLLCRWEEEALINEERDALDNKNTEGHASTLTFVTQIGISSQDLQMAQILYTFDKVVPVVQATVNSSRTLLGFVVRAEVKDKGGLMKYSAFVAEIAPQKSVYSLNIDCYRQILVEFLKTELPGKPLSKAWIAKLLVFIHRESISIYSFPLGEKDEKWVVEDQPLTETVVRCFVWAQWVPSHLHLYYLHHRPPPEVGLAFGLDVLRVEYSRE